MKHYIPLLLASFTVLTACQSRPNEVTEIAFAKSFYSLNVGESVDLRVILTGGEKEVQYLSGNADIASIEASGTLVARGSGDTTIYAICNDHIAQAAVHVNGKTTEEKTYLVKGTINASFALPAFSINGELNAPLTFAYQRGGNPKFYFEVEVENPLIQSFLDFRQSIFILQNPYYEMPQKYDEICRILEKSTAKVSLKSFYEDSILTTLFFEGENNLGKVEYNLEETQSDLNLALDVLKGFSLESLGELDLGAIVYALLNDGDSTLFESTAARLLRTVMYYATLSTHKNEDAFSLSLSCNSSLSQGFFELLDNVTFGEDASIASINATAVMQKEEDAFFLSGISIESVAHLFDEDNSFVLAIQVPHAPEEITPEAFEALEETFR